MIDMPEKHALVTTFPLTEISLQWLLLFRYGRRPEQNTRQTAKRKLNRGKRKGSPTGHSAVIDKRKASNPFSSRSGQGNARRSPRHILMVAFLVGYVMGVKHKLQWDVEPTELNYYPVLITFAFWSIRNSASHVFVAQNGFKQIY